MNKRYLPPLFFAGLIYIIAISVLPSCSMNNNGSRMKTEAERLIAKTAELVKSNLIQQYEDIPEKDAAEPSVSGPITAVPWENDEIFKESREKNGTPVMMAAFRTVLRDPLPGEEYNVHMAAGLLAGIVVEPGQVFSQNRSIGPYTESKGFKKGPTYMGTQLTTTIGGGVCKIASTLYNVTILSNLQVIERQAHTMPVPYVPYGQDATVAYGARDFKFKNDTSSPVLIWAQGIDNILYIAFYGKVKPPRVEWNHEIFDVQKAPRVYRNNPEMPIGSEKVILEGMDGATVKSWLTIESLDGSNTIKQLGLSYYRPMPYIIERGG